MDAPKDRAGLGRQMGRHDHRTPRLSALLPGQHIRADVLQRRGPAGGDGGHRGGGRSLRDRLRDPDQPVAL